MQNHIIKFFLSAMFLSFPCAYFTAEGESVPTESPAAAVKAADEVVSLYHSMQLEGVVNWRAFKQAVTGYNRIKNRKRDVLTLIFQAFHGKAPVRVRHEAPPDAVFLGSVARKEQRWKLCYLFFQ